MTAVDLGCGHGLQTLALSQRGFNVVAIDTSALLLAELLVRADKNRVTIVNDDLCNFANHLTDKVGAIVCMGDTITHLSTMADVHSLVRIASRWLNVEGTLCLSFRDYASNEFWGTDWFIPVRSDEDRIHMCFLDCGKDTVSVHDIIHERSEHGWKTTISAYKKLRLSPAEVVNFAVSQGLTVSQRSVHRGMVYLAFTLHSGLSHND